MNYAKGIMWLDDCRIPFVDGDKFDIRRYDEYHDTFSSYEDNGSAKGKKYEVNEPDMKGRFTPNLLVCDDLLNDGSVSKAGDYKGDGSKSGGIWNKSTGKPAGIEYGDKGTNSRYYDLDMWFDKMIEKLK